jgi:hypothetical protein
MSKKSTFLALLGASTIAVSVLACGGSQTVPSESPATEPSEAPAEATDAGTEGTHTMPDGTEMPGHHHDEGGSEDKTDKK